MLLFCMGSLKLSNSNQGVVLKLFKKCKGQPISKRGTNILTSYTYIFVFCKFFWKITDSHWLINVKSFL